MRFDRLARRCALACATACVVLPAASADGARRVHPAAALEPITVRGSGFETARTHRPFLRYGFNYAAPSDYIEAPTAGRLATMREGFSKMHAMGGNIVRIHLQLPTFMRSPRTLDRRALRALRTVLATASDAGLRVDVTGNLVWTPAESPAWYERMSEQARWETQAIFWRRVARVGAKSDAVMFYELTSEPLIVDGIDARIRGAWYTGEFGGLFFGHRIALNLNGRPARDVARAWTAQMSAAVRAGDPNHLITIGLLPDVEGAFAPSVVARELDFLTVHIYPETGHAREAIDVARRFAATGKPVVLGEWLMLYGDRPCQRAFLSGSRRYLAGHISFFDGRDLLDIGQPRTVLDAIYSQSLEDFLKLAPASAPHARRSRTVIRHSPATGRPLEDGARRRLGASG
jgi:hypothetical protein